MKFSDVKGEELENLEVELRKAMWDYVGIIRNEENLSLMLRKLGQLEKRINELNGNGINVLLLELKNMATLSKLVTKAAQLRKESRGTHFREDYPATDDEDWLKHICLERKREKLLVSFA
jgi:succinate dehydrogenase/fumarate reductase flavoprotein subunit